MLFSHNQSVDSDDGVVREEEWQTLMSFARSDRVKLAQKLRNGMSTKTLEALDRARKINIRLLTDHGLVTVEDWEAAVERGKTTGQLTDLMLRYIRIQTMAIEVWGVDQASVWLREKNRALGDEAPLSLIDSDPGASAVEALLGQIAHGIAS